MSMYDKWFDFPTQELPKWCDFPREEYEVRWKRARELMAQNKIDALVVSNTETGKYMTGWYGWWGDIAFERVTLFVLQAEGEPTLITHDGTWSGGQISRVRRSTWLKNAVVLPEKDLGERNAQELWTPKQVVKHFKKLGLEKATLGWELGYCTRLGISYNDFNRFKELMPKAKFVNASPILLKLLRVKSDREIALMRRTSEIRIAASEKFYSELRVGMTEKEAWKICNECYMEAGADSWSYSIDVRNPTRYKDNALQHEVPTDRTFKDQDFFYDGGTCSWHGGICDIQRLNFISPSGNVPEIIKKYYKIAWEQLEAERQAVKPGVKCSEVFEAQAKVLRKYKLQEFTTEGRRGHGMGIIFRNGMSIHPDSQIVLEPGMTLSIEPSFVNKYGYFSLEDNVVVTEKGCDTLHKPAPGPDVPVIG